MPIGELTEDQLCTLCAVCQTFRDSNPVKYRIWDVRAIEEVLNAEVEKRNKIINGWS